MPRKNRVHYRHAFYHVMTRGNNKQAIFLAEKDYHAYLAILEKTATTLGFHIHLFCLMTNHIHFVIEVRDVPLSKIMQCINTTYTNSHNKRHSKVGHLFQGRYKAKLIHDDQYLIELGYYIHMNPIKAGICKNLEDYPWSSHHHYKTTNKIIPPWLTTSYLISLLSSFSVNHSERYLNFMNEFNSSPANTLYCKFDNSGDLILNVSIHDKMRSQPSLALENLALKEIIITVCDYLDIDHNRLESHPLHRECTFAKAMIAYFAHYHAKYTLKDIASYFCMQPESLSKTMHKYLLLTSENKAMKAKMDALESRLSIKKGV